MLDTTTSLDANELMSLLIARTATSLRQISLGAPVFGQMNMLGRLFDPVIRNKLSWTLSGSELRCEGEWGTGGADLFATVTA